MSNHKIAGLLIPMASSKKVIREFARYIKDAYPANAVHLTGLVRYAMKKEKLKDDDFEKEKVFKVLFPEEEYKLSRMDNIYASSIKLAEKFLLGRALDKRRDLKNHLLAESLNDIQLETHAKRKLQNNLDNLPDNEEKRFEAKEKAHQMIYFKMSANMKDKKKNRQHLVGAFRANKIRSTIAELKYCCEFLVRNLLLGEPFEEGIAEEINAGLAYIPHRDSIPLIDVLADLAYLFQDPSTERYRMLKEKFFLSHGMLHSEKADILSYLISAVSLVAVDDRLREYFELYRHGVEQGYLIENNRISSSLFNNIVSIACESHEATWAEGFIASYFQYLSKPPELLRNIGKIYECFLLFSRKEYQTVLDKIDGIYFEDYSYGLYKHTFLIKCTYEIHQHRCMDEMLKLMDSFRSFLNKKVLQRYITKAIKLRYFNSMLVVKKLIEYPYDKKSTKNGLLAYYESYEGETVYDKWLRGKIDQLK